MKLTNIHTGETIERLTPLEEALRGLIHHVDACGVENGCSELQASIDRAKAVLKARGVELIISDEDTL